MADTGGGAGATRGAAAGERPDCFACRSFFVTHESPHRYGCRFFGMKTPVLPSIAVLKSSGEPCRAFEPKPGRPH